MKRTLHWAALGLAAGMLAACGGSGGSEPQAEGPPQPAESDAAAAAAGTDEADLASAPSETADTAAQETASQFAGFPEPYASAEYDRGRRVFLQCQSCHTLEEGGQAVLGPNLYGLFGREVGTMDGFEFSPALQEADFDWTPEQLDQWLANPREFLPGNRMTFAGVRRPDDRTAVIAYVMAETGYAPD